MTGEIVPGKIGCNPPLSWVRYLLRLIRGLLGSHR
jgi:hypothetical protein